MINHSFAVMAYKNSPYLDECLDSLKKQTVESVIYITTSTPSEYITTIAKKYEAQVFIMESGKGITHDWNFSLKNAKTKYVTLAHQDDLYMPNYVESCFNAAEKFKDTLICFTDYSEIVNEKDRSNTLLLRIKRFMLWFFMPLKKNIRSKIWKRVSLSMGSPIPTPGVMYNLNNLSSFEFSEQFSINLDWDAWYRMAKMNGRFVYVPSILLKHRIHSDSETTAGLKTNIRQTEDLKMFTMFWPKLIARLFAKLYERSYKSNSN
jgi:glycosyltransferase involved in cell wall biosynthesis